MITMISPCPDFTSETLSSLSFAKRAKRIKNRPKMNEEINHKALIKQYEIQLRNLRDELQKKNEILEKNPFMRQVDQLNEEKKNIMNQLEQTSQMYYKERDEKKNLENKIEIINKDFEKYKNNNNIQIEKTPQFISAIEEKQNSLLKEFDNKLQEFQRENNKNINNNINNNNEEIERYKQLILKQREMMSTLTKKINERDETILQLQEDNEAYEKINEQLDNYIFLLNQNFKNLIEYCQQKSKNDDINLENYLNIYKKINNDISKNKNETNNNMGKNSQNNANNKNDINVNTKNYLPYSNKIINIKNINSSFNSSISIFNNININTDSPTILLSADEKIKELKGIIKEKENEINILKLVSQKFLSNSCESEEGKININQIKKSFQNGFELHAKIRELEEEKQKLKNENDILNDKLFEYQSNIYKIQNILEDIKLNNINNTNKNESLEKIVDNLNVGQAVEDINIIINKLISNNIENLNLNNRIYNSYISEEILIKGNKNNSMDKDSIDDKDIIKTLSNIKNSRNEFNPKIQQIISFNEKNNKYNEYNINNTFSSNKNNCFSVGRKIKDDNLAKIANSLNNKSLFKKRQYKNGGEQKFLNKFINVDK